MTQHGLAPAPVAVSGLSSAPHYSLRSPAQPTLHPVSSRQAVTCRALPLASTVASGVPPNWDFMCTVGASLAAYVWVKMFDKLAGAGIIDQKLSRKLVHSTAGPLFVLVWPFFSDAPYARFFAAAVPSLNLIRLSIVGSGLMNDPGLIKSVSRAGDKNELLKGPLYYVLVMISLTCLFWRHHPAALLAISMMCGGDGLADIVGRRWGTSKLPWNSNKSWAGSLAMFLGGMAMAGGFIALFCSLGYFPCYQAQYMAPYVALVCLLSALVESLPINQWLDDNISVAGVAVGAGYLLLPYVAAASQGCGLDAAVLQQTLRL